HPQIAAAPQTTKRYVRYGSSPRGAQAILLGGKLRAVVEGRFSVSCEDVRHVAPSALRHRLILNFEGEAEGIDPHRLIEDVVAATPEQVGAWAHDGQPSGVRRHGQICGTTSCSRSSRCWRSSRARCSPAACAPSAARARWAPASSSPTTAIMCPATTSATWTG